MRIGIKRDQKELDMIAQGFRVGDLGKLMMGSETANSNTMGLEDLYDKMLVKLHSLASQVDKSNAKVLEMENYNRKLRYKVASPDQNNCFSACCLYFFFFFFYIVSGNFFFYRGFSFSFVALKKTGCSSFRKQSYINDNKLQYK